MKAVVCKKGRTAPPRWCTWKGVYAPIGVRPLRERLSGDGKRPELPIVPTARGSTHSPRTVLTTPRRSYRFQLTEATLILSQKVCASRIRTNVPTPGYNIQSLFRILAQHTVALRCAESLELPQNGFLRGNQPSLQCSRGGPDHIAHSHRQHVLIVPATPIPLRLAASSRWRT